jgi:hypothetical protein
MEKTKENTKSKKYLTPAQKRRKENFIRKCSHVVQKKFIEPWLYKKNEAFNGKKPIDLIIENNTIPLERMIYQLGSGEPMS